MADPPKKRRWDGRIFFPVGYMLAKKGARIPNLHDRKQIVAVVQAIEQSVLMRVHRVVGEHYGRVFESEPQHSQFSLTALPL